MKRSWIFSTYNEIKSSFFWKNLEFLRSFDEDIIITDGASKDGTLEELEKLHHKFKVIPNSTRGLRFSDGALRSSSDFFIFVHPRSLIPENAIDQLDQLLSHQLWGAFTHSFDVSSMLLNFTSWWSNHVRGDLQNIYYLDHILWTQKYIYNKVGGFPIECLFEDTLFCERLRHISLPIRLSEKVVTSSVRFQQNGFWRQVFVNQVCKLLFFFKCDFKLIESIYEKNLELNRQIQKK